MKKVYTQHKNNYNNNNSNNQNKDNPPKQIEKQKKPENENYKITYSQYGYIKIEESQYLNKELTNLPFIKITQKENKDTIPLTGKINRINLIETISLSLKTFYGKRETYFFEKISIFSPLSTLIEELSKKETEMKIKEDLKLKKGKQYRIFSPRIKIHELIPEKSIYENNILNLEKLILLPQKKIQFSETMKGGFIILSKNNSTASKTNRDDPQYIMSDYPIHFGKHYFEITLHTEPYEKSVVIGIATKREPYNLNSYDVQTFHGFILS